MPVISAVSRAFGLFGRPQEPVTVDCEGCEFGYEVIMVLPYVYYLHRARRLVTVRTCTGMLPFYYFLPAERCIEAYNKRRYTLPSGLPLKTIHQKHLDTSRWRMPDYRRYKKLSLDVNFPKPPLLVSNKYNTEWRKPPVNYLSLDLLSAIIALLRDHFTIIYNRPSPGTITDDNSLHGSFLDKEHLKAKHPEVVFLEDISPHLPINQVQLMVSARADYKISVQGGSSILSSLTGGYNFIFAAKGQELKHNSYAWYKKFSGCRVFHAGSYDKLLDLLHRHIPLKQRRRVAPTH